MRFLPLTALTLACSTALAAGPLNFEDAARLALARLPDGRVHSVERETHLGREVFEVEVHTPDGCEHELVLSATDGEMIRQKRDCD